jgi:hypothetical protein
VVAYLVHNFVLIVSLGKWCVKCVNGVNRMRKCCVKGGKRCVKVVVKGVAKGVCKCCVSK